MNAIKKSYQKINNELIEQVYGSIPAVYWTDENGNNFRALAMCLPFYNDQEIYMVDVKVQVQPNGLPDWLFIREYKLSADDSKYRSLTTGELTDSTIALDENGNLNPGYVTNGKFFTIAIGYNPTGAIVNVFDWIYTNIADREGLTLI